MVISTINAETWDDAFEPDSLKNKGLPAQVTWEPMLTILFHPDYQRIGDRVALPELIMGEAVAVSRTAPDFCSPEEAWGDPLRDGGISRQPFYLEGLEGGGVRLKCDQCKTRVEVDGELLRWGAEFNRERMRDGVVIQLAERIVLLLHLMPPVGEAGTDHMDMVGDSAGMRRVRADIKRIADLDVTVFLRGETGTGKEVAARALHLASPRYKQKLVSVNLGALPSGVASAELFGAVRGAYTGAVRNQDGYFRAAHGGTLFLDEIGETSPDIQAMLLRVLETGEICPVGSQASVTVDARIVAATDANLEQLVENGSFKAPLLHRLSGYEVWLPPLRERRDDIGRLFMHFARAEMAQIGEEHRLQPGDRGSRPWIPARLMARLARYRWPGNIRQLRNVVRQLLIGSRGLPQVTAPPAVERLLTELDAATPAAADAPLKPLQPIPETRVAPKRRKPSTVTEVELVEALERNAWNLKATALSLNISRASLYAMIKKNPDLQISADLDEAAIRESFEQHDGNVEAMAEALKVSKHALNRRLFELNLIQSP